MPDLSALLAPRSIATGSVARCFDHSRQSAADASIAAVPGKIYPVSRRHPEIQGIKAFASISALPPAVDLAVIAVPANDVPAALEDCGKAGVRAAYIISSGFAEEGAGKGALLEAELRQIAERYDMAICGPNGEGLFNRVDNVVANFSPAFGNAAQPLAPETDLGKAIRSRRRAAELVSRIFIADVRASSASITS